MFPILKIKTKNILVHRTGSSATKTMTYPSLSLSYPPSRLIGIGAGWVNAGRAKRDAITEQCAAYLRLQRKGRTYYMY